MPSIFRQLFSSPTRRFTDGFADESAFLEQFRRQLDDDLVRISRKAMAQALRNTDRSFRTAINELLTLSVREIGNQLGTGSSSVFSSARSLRSLESGVTRLLDEVLSDALTRRETTVRTTETERSREYESRFRQSSGQMQAEAARNIGQAQRNL